MGGVKKYAKGLGKFYKQSLGGGFVRDSFKKGGPVKAFKKTANIGAGLYGAKAFKEPKPDDREGQVNALLGQATEEQRRAAAQAMMYQQKGLAGIGPAYADARSRVTVGRGASMDAASDRAAQSGADAQQSLTARGLYNTTVLDNARVGISGQLSRDMAEIDAQHQQILGGLDIGEAQAMQQGYSALAGTSLAGASGIAGGLSNQAQAIANVQEEDPDAWLNSLLGIGGTVLGAYMTGGGSLFAQGASGGGGFGSNWQGIGGKYGS